MTLEEKKRKGKLVRSMRMSKQSLRIPTKQKRINSVVIFAITAIYTIFTKIVFSKTKGNFFATGQIFTFDNLMMLAVIINLVVVLVITVFGNSIYSLNHYRAFRRLQALSSICKLIIFGSAIATALTNLNEVTMEAYGITFGDYLSERISNITTTPSILVNDGVINILNTAKYVSLLIAIISIFPAIFFFFKSYGFIFLFFALIYSGLFFLAPFFIYTDSRNFVEYVPDPKDEDYVIKNFWKLPSIWWHKFVIAVVEIFLIAIVVFFILLASGVIKTA